MQTIHVRINQTLLKFIDRQVQRGKKQMADLDQTFDRSKYIRQLIRQDMKQSKPMVTEEPPQHDEGYADLLQMVRMPDRR